MTNAGQFIVPKILPILQKGLRSDDGIKRKGVCLGLVEVLKASTKRLLEEYQSQIIPSVRQSLCDSLESVRHASAKAFVTLVKIFGDEAVNQIVPPLVKQLDEIGEDLNDFNIENMEHNEDDDEDEDERYDGNYHGKNYDDENDEKDMLYTEEQPGIKGNKTKKRVFFVFVTCCVSVSI